MDEQRVHALDRIDSTMRTMAIRVRPGSAIRIGIGRDEDGHFDRDELDAGSDPADPASTPGDPGIPGDLNGDGLVGLTDLLILLTAWGPCPPTAG